MLQNMAHMKFLEWIANNDIDELKRKESTYKGSWKKRGGVGAFMMMARKWDRIEGMLEARHYDVFDLSFISTKGYDGTLVAELQDLRRYLLLIEAEIYAREEPNRPGTPDDGGHHIKLAAGASEGGGV